MLRCFCGALNEISSKKRVASVGDTVFMASSTCSLFGSLASSTSGFRFDPAAIMTLLFLGIAADGDFRERAVDERSPGVASDSNFRSVRETMGRLCRSPTEDGEEMEDVCLNGGSCTSMEDQEEDALFCRFGTGTTWQCCCSFGWTGDFCQFPLKTTEINLGLTYSTKLDSARTMAAISTCVLFIAAAILSTFVYFRYRRKERLLEDRLFRATAEELYRRPFNNRSSIVESLSRLNSVRRTGTNGRDNGAKGSSSLELNIQAECHSLTSELGRDFETKLIRQPSSASRAGGVAGGRAPGTSSANRNELTV